MKNIFLSTILLLLGGCDTQYCPKRGVKSLENKTNCAEKASPLSFLSDDSALWPQHFSFPRVSALVKGGDLAEASRYINGALQISPDNANLHTLNGFIYEEMARSGDDSRKELVSVAYKKACSIDPSNGKSFYLLGMSELQERKFDLAQEHLANAMILCPYDPDILYALSFASYYMQDIPVALSSIEKALALRTKDPSTVRAAAIIYASAGNFSKAFYCLKTYKELVGSGEEDVHVVQRRISEWRDVHTRAGLKKVLSPEAEGKSANMKYATDFQEFEKKRAASSDSGQDAPSIIFDCYLLRTSEVQSTNKGNNIFESFQATLGPASGTFNRQIEKIGSGPNPIKGSWSRIFNFPITTELLAYSLNIMNASESKIEVIGRPSVATLVGKPAYFLQGDQYTGASTGGITGASISSVDAGTKIEITPLELSKDGLVTAEVMVAGSVFPVEPNTSVGASSQLFVLSRSKVSTTIKAYLGQTVMLGGLYARTNTSTKSGFPILQDIPILQYFTANNSTSSDTRCVIYLLTPRRGGNTGDCPPMPTQRNVCVADQLKRRGLMSLGEYPSLYYILKAFSQSELFTQFRSGDLPAPFWGSTCVSLSKKLDQIRSFLWF